MKITVGIDVGGGRHDRTAIVAVETVSRWVSSPQARPERLSVVTYLERLPAAAPLDVAADSIVRLMFDPILGQARYIMDSTGIGEALAQMLADRKRKGLAPRWVTSVVLTGGREPTPGTIPKSLVFNSLVAAHQSDRLSFADGLPAGLKDQLVRELVGFRPRFTATGGLTFGNDPRLEAYDDLVVALGLAVHFPGRGEERYLARDGAIYESFDASADPY